MTFARDNTASALTRAIKAALPGVAVKVKSDDYTKAAAVTGEPTPLRLARERLALDPRFHVIETANFQPIQDMLYVVFASQRP